MINSNLALHAGKRIFLLVSFLIIILAGCKPDCSQTEIIAYIDEINTIHATFTEYTNQSANHPELKTGDVEKMNTMLNEFSQLEPPACAEDLSDLALKAMRSSITYLAPTQDVFYYPYQLAKFALDDWQAVDDAAEEFSNIQGN